MKLFYTPEESFVKESKALSQGSQVAFYFMKQKKMFYFPRFWEVKDQKEYNALLNYVCNIDLIIHPEIKSFPQKYELQNKGNGPVLVPIEVSDG